MNSVPLYILIGSILGIISAIVLLILHTQEVIFTIRSFLRWLYVWLKERPRVFREWLWWRKYRPSWRIISHGNIKISRDGEEFLIEIPVIVEYEIGNDRYHTDMDCTSVFLDIYHAGRGWEKQPYRLSSKTGCETWKLKTTEVRRRVEYIFATHLPAKPLTTNTAVCKIIYAGYATIWIPHVQLDGEINCKGNDRFEAIVLWELGNDVYDKENQA